VDGAAPYNRRDNHNDNHGLNSLQRILPRRAVRRSIQIFEDSITGMGSVTEKLHQSLIITRNVVSLDSLTAPTLRIDLSFIQGTRVETFKEFGG